MNAHPLKTWLTRKGMMPYKFAEEQGISFSAIYKHLSGKVFNPSLDVLEKIERGTGGSVTIKKQKDWLYAKRDQRK